MKLTFIVKKVDNLSTVPHKIICMFYELFFDVAEAPPAVERFQRWKLVVRRCHVQVPVTIVDLADKSFPWFSPKLP